MRVFISITSWAPQALQSSLQSAPLLAVRSLSVLFTEPTTVLCWVFVFFPEIYVKVEHSIEQKTYVFVPIRPLHLSKSDENAGKNTT